MAFGGAWTGQKLDILNSYLNAYTTALKNTSFKLAYIDAFAGAGIREVMPPNPGELFDDLLADDDASYRHGSPLIALGTNPAFHHFVFIERDAASIEKLKDQVSSSFPYKADQVSYHLGDANDVLRELCAKNWNGHRAVAFLDPFALHVSWGTIAGIAATKAIDMWLLFPAMAVNRMLARDGDIPETWKAKLADAFGSDDWEQAFYKKDDADLFGIEPTSKVPHVFKALSEYITRRLSSVFAAVVDSPLLLCNSTGSPLFMLCFASGNPKGAVIAKRIANHIINKTNYGQ
jgi:three-Cys-motif partner protein